MAELALGAVSLGLQVCNGIIVCLDAVKSRGHDIETVERKTLSVQHVLESIQGFLSRTKKAFPANPNVTECIASCDIELKALESLVAGLVGCSSATPDWLPKVKTLAKKLSYAFDRPKLQQLETRLDQTISALQLAVQLLNL